MSAQVPDLMKIGAIETEMTQDVQTIITEPVVFTQNTCRITLQNIGFLHSMSRLVLQVEAGDKNALNASNCNATFPAGVGINALIERCSLTIGGKTICELEDYNAFMAYKSMFIPNEVNKERESVVSGRIINLEPHFSNRSDNSASSYTIDNGTYPFDSATAPTGFKKPSHAPSASFVGSGIQVNDNLLVRNEPELQCFLSDLFPFLRFNQLPLYMMAEQVAINITWRPLRTATSRVALQGTGHDTTQVFNVKDNSVKLIADYLTFPGEIMRQYAEANKVLNFNYVDYRLTKRTYNGQSASAQTKQIVNCGGAGRIVNKMFVAMNTDGESANRMLGRGFSSKAPGINASGNVQILTTNDRYNDEYLYPIDRKNPALEYHDIVQTESMIPHISKDMYNQEGGGTGGGGLTDSLAAAQYNGHAPGSNTLGIRGQFFYQAHRLNKNERINSRGIELETQYSELPGLAPNNNYTQRVWIELLRTATLNSGVFDCYFA